jgi:predicted dehydrogenase
MSVVNAAIVGLGEWGQKLVRSVQGKDGNIRFVAAMAKTPAKVAAFAEEQGLRLYSDFPSLLSDVSVEAIVLTTPHSYHASQALAAARAGKAVFVEKPFTLTKVSAVEVADACHRERVVLAFGHNRRFLPALTEMKDIVDTKSIGTPLQIEGNLSSNSGYRHGPSAWRASRVESPAGGMTSLGIHVLDAMIYLLGDVSEVSTYSRRLALPIDIDDSTATIFKFVKGPVGYLGTVFASMPFWRLHVFGSEGWVEMRGPDTLLVMGRDGKLQERRYPSVDIERVELEAFADAVRGKSRYPVSAAEAIHGVAVLESIAASAESNTPIAVQ